MTSRLIIIGKANTISAQIAEIAARWDGRHIPAADADGFTLHIPARSSAVAQEAGRGAPSSSAPARTPIADTSAALCPMPHGGAPTESTLTLGQPVARTSASAAGGVGVANAG
jgi:hypothetical protein